MGYNKLLSPKCHHKMFLYVALVYEIEPHSGYEKHCE